MRGRRLALLALLLAACKAGPPSSELPPPPPSVRVLADTLVLERGPVGIEDRQEAAYVFVEAENGSSEPRQVSVEGDLYDAAGKVVAPLFIDEMYVPAGEQRTFALVATGAFPEATAAKARVRFAPVAKDAPAAAIASVTTERMATSFNATVNVENKIDKQVIATVIVTFYDQAGKIAGRPFKFLAIAPRGTRQYIFEGPREAVTAKAFLGDVVY
jgi:hypothetical protein